MAQLLIECGVDVSALDHKRNTPLHTAAKIQNYHNGLVELLLNHGSHIDQINGEGERPAAMLLKLPSCTIHPLQHISLQCLAASVIKSQGISYRGEVPVSLEPFIEKH